MTPIVGNRTGAQGYLARLLATTAAIGVVTASPAPAAAQAEAEAQAFDIPAQPLAQALMHFTRETGIELFFDDAIARGITSQGARGSFTPEQALRQLLAGTGLTYRFTNSNTVTLAKIADAEGGVQQLAPITVEGAAARFGDLPEPPGFKADYQASATKTPLAIKDTPQSISVTTRESIDLRQARDLLSALELTAGVVPGNSSGGGPFAGHSPRVADQFSLRGQRLDGDRDVRIDGFAAGAQRNDFDLAAFERVEVVKGPSSMLYGQGSVGGFINLVRKRPREEPGANVAGQIGSYDSYRGEADVTGAFDPQARLLGRLTLVYEDAGSFVDDVDSNRVLAAPTLEVRISDSTRALLDLLYQEDEFQPSLGVPLRLRGDELTIPDIKRSFYFGVPASEDSTTKEGMASLQLDHQINDRWLATLLLQLENFNPEQRYATDFDDLAVFTRQCERLMAHWQAALPLRMLEVRYEDTVAGLERQARRLIDFVGAPWDARCLEFHARARVVQTPSRWQVRQPVHARSVGRWRAYAPHLPELGAAFPPHLR